MRSEMSGWTDAGDAARRDELTFGCHSGAVADKGDVEANGAEYGATEENGANGEDTFGSG